MGEYTNTITLTNNSRGIWSIDPTIGCASGMVGTINGCYGDCYAARYSKKYGYDFSKTVLRYFKDDKHIKSIVNRINKIELPFIRMGTSGDPSENWEHTLSIIRSLGSIKKEIVIITKHWENLTTKQLIELKEYNVCINTSISALDKKELRENGIKQYEILKEYCNSVLRVVSCDFNVNNWQGLEYFNIQHDLFSKYNVLDTIFRCSKNNPLVLNGIINTKETKFLGKKCNVSKYNKKAYFGKCSTCIEKCGVGLIK